MKKILLCMVFFVSYATTSHAMEEKENQESATHSLPTKPDEKNVKEYLIGHINEILEKGRSSYTYGENTWEFKCSLNFFDEWKHHHKGLTISDMISSHNLILYPSISSKEDNGTTHNHNNSNFLVFIGNEGRNVLNLYMNRIN